MKAGDRVRVDVGPTVTGQTGNIRDVDLGPNEFPIRTRYKVLLDSGSKYWFFEDEITRLRAPNERLYTLEEAEQVLEERKCDVEGHDFEHIMELQSNAPVRIVCARCGKTWNVVGH